MKNYFFLFLIILSYSCKKDVINKNKFSEFKNDTIFSKGNQIVFFKPSEIFFKKELSSIEAIEELDSDFNYYSNEVYNDINNKLKLPLKAKISESRYLAIIDFRNDTTFIDRYKDSLYYGTLLNFLSKKHHIIEGVFTDEDLIENLLPKEKEIDFNKSPINIKKLILNESKYYVTSSSIDKKYLEKNCDTIDYKLIRGYNIIPIKNKFIINELIVYVKENKYEWSREKANELFKSLIVKDNSIKPWNSFSVGMKKKDLIDLIKFEEYHQEKKVIILNSIQFHSKFFFDVNGILEKIEIQRRCKNEE